MKRTTSAEAYVKTNSLTSLYDSVLIPTVTLAEMDAQRDELDAEQRSAIHRHIHDLIEDLGSAPPSKSQLEADKAVAEHTAFPSLRSHVPRALRAGSGLP